MMDRRCKKLSAMDKLLIKKVKENELMYKDYNQYGLYSTPERRQRFFEQFAIDYNKQLLIERSNENFTTGTICR